MPKLLGIIGILVLCAGLDSLNQSKSEIRFWLAAYVRIFRALLQHGEPSHVFRSEESPPERHGAARVFLGRGFAFFLGPILIVLSLTLFLYPNL
jgi:hypothetical protein